MPPSQSSSYRYRTDSREIEAMRHGLKRAALLLPILAPVFLTACASGEVDTLKAENQQLKQELATTQQQLDAEKAQVSRLQGAIKYTVNSDLLFPSGGWQMSPGGQKIIARLAEKLAPTQQSKILVNGYTDDKPIGPALQQQGITTNEQLSQKRADTVMQYLTEHGVKPDMVSAHGYGEADPVAPNDTSAGRAQNRRVEITLAPTG